MRHGVAALVLLAALAALPSCSQVGRQFAEPAVAERPRPSPVESLADCAVSTLLRPPVLAAVTGGLPGVAVASGTRLAFCTVRSRMTESEEKEETEPATSRTGRRAT